MKSCENLRKSVKIYENLGKSMKSHEVWFEHKSKTSDTETNNSTHCIIPLIAPQSHFPIHFGTQCTSQGPTVQHLRPRAPPELTASTHGTGVWLPTMSTGIGVLLPNVSLWGLAANQAQHAKKTHQGTQQKQQPSSCASGTKGSRRLSAKSVGPSAMSIVRGVPPRSCWAPHPHPCRDSNATGTTLTLPLSAIRTHVGTDAPMRGQHLGHIQPPPTARATRAHGNLWAQSGKWVVRGKRCGLWEQSGQVPARDDNACPAALDPRYI
jgi:hypothetical protein